MAEYINEDKPMIIVNETDSNFDVGVGLVFRKSGIYEIFINDKTTTVTKISERKTWKWIPCSERLPEKSGKYYVSGEDRVWICDFLIIPNFVGGWCSDVANPEVQAWMPFEIPEPYQEDNK